MAKRSKPLRRPMAGQQGGCSGGRAPPPKIILSLLLMIIIIIIIIIIKIKRPNGEALEASPPANGRPAGEVRGGQRPPAFPQGVGGMAAQPSKLLLLLLITNH